MLDKVSWKERDRDYRKTYFITCYFWVFFFHSGSVNLLQEYQMGYLIYILKNGFPYRIQNSEPFRLLRFHRQNVIFYEISSNFFEASVFAAQKKGSWETVLKCLVKEFISQLWNILSRQFHELHEPLTFNFATCVVPIFVYILIIYSKEFTFHFGLILCFTIFVVWFIKQINVKKLLSLEKFVNLVPGQIVYIILINIQEQVCAIKRKLFLNLLGSKLRCNFVLINNISDLW